MSAKGRSRRLFLRQAGIVVGGGLVVAATGGLSWRAFEKSANNCEQEDICELGERIRDWKLTDGTKMNEVIPGLNLAADVYSKNSLEEYMPTANHPISVVYEDKEISGRDGTGRLALYNSFSEDTSKKVRVSAPGIESYDLPLISELNPMIKLPTSMKGTTAELVLAAKEAHQVAEYKDYVRYYIDALRETGAEITLVNPGNEDISNDLVNFTVAVNQSMSDMRQFGKSWIGEFVDIGAHIRLGGIAYANWKVNYPSEYLIVDNGFTNAGEKVAGFLQQEGIIHQRENTFVFTNGSAPEIGSEQFQSVFSKYSGLPGR